MRSMITILMLHFSLSALSQQQVTVMSYNLLNFPTGNLAGREDTLRIIIDHVRPDIFLIQELKTDSGLQLIANRSFEGLSSTYTASTFVPQQSGTGGFSLQQAMVYNTDLFGLLSEGYLMTAVRDINKFCLYWKDPMLAQGADTVKLYLFVTHLKSSQGSDNAASRLSMAQTFTTHLQYLPSNASVIFAGDLNLYTSTEAAYQELLDTTNAIVFRDPIDSPGAWNSSSFTKREIHTQSTRGSSIFGDGAGGGMDDRFDFILVSRNMMGPVHSIAYVADSYDALGNDGTCYNQSITACAGGEVPYEVMQAMYHMSDHLPVVMELQFTSGLTGLKESTATIAAWWTSSQGLHVQWPSTEPVSITLTDMLGRSMYSSVHYLSEGANLLPMPIPGSSIYILRMTGRHRTTAGKIQMW